MTASKMHEIRMWTVQVIIPVTLFAGYVYFCTDVPHKIKQKAQDAKNKKKKGTN